MRYGLPVAVAESPTGQRLPAKITATVATQPQIKTEFLETSLASQEEY